MTEPLSVVLVEDHPTFRLGLRARLEIEDDITVTADVGSAEEAIAVIVEQMPDVAVVDLNLPGQDGVGLTRQLAAHTPSVRVLVLTMLDGNHVFSAVRAGAKGYLLKDSEPTQIVAAIRTVAHGDTVFSAGIAKRLIAASSSTEQGAWGNLSTRETEILTLVAQGLTNAEIGRRLFLSPKTVRNYVSNVIGKLQVADRAAAAIHARQAGLLERP